MLIFKGTTNGQIANPEFGAHPDRGHYCCQQKAWMDKAMLHKWIDLKLVPWRQTMLLILDAHQHMMGMDVNGI